MIKYFLYCLSVATFLISFVQNGIVQSATNVKRQAGNSNVKKRAASVSSSKTSSGATAKHSSGSSKKTTSKKGSSSKSSIDDTEVGAELKCLQGKLSEILAGACKFLLDDDIRAGLGSEDLYCVYNYRDVGKTSSIYNYYLGAYYGISESAVKANTSIVNVKNNAKNALKYYQYLIDEINAETLKESKILDSVTTEVLKNADMDFSVENTIERKTIESVPISIDVIESDITNCTKLTKAALTECSAVGNIDVKNKIAESCSSYNSVLIKLAGDKKAEALGYDAEIIAVLKQRVNADFYDYRDMVLLEQEKVELQETYSDLVSKKALLDNKSSRSSYAEKANKLKDEIDTTSSEDVKKSKEEQLALYINQICKLDKLILKADKDYVPLDDWSDNCSTSSSSTSSSSSSSSGASESSSSTSSTGTK